MVCFHYISLVAIQIVIIEKVTTCTANLALNYLICNVILLFYCIALIKNDKIKLYIKNGVVVATHPHFFLQHGLVGYIKSVTGTSESEQEFKNPHATS